MVGTLCFEKLISSKGLMICHVISLYMLNITEKVMLRVMSQLFEFIAKRL